MISAKWYAIQAQVGNFGSVCRHQKSLIARVEGASSKAEALQMFRVTSPQRAEYETEWKALTPSQCTKAEADWIENYVEEVIRK